MSRTRPVLFVLAGVNGAGKSSVGGHLLEQRGLSWFNPDAFAREVRSTIGSDVATANSLAWQEGMRRLETALATGQHHALETTLGGRSLPAKILEATHSHDVLIWYCGLASPEQHIARVQARVAAGGHDIPEALIRRRHVSALANLIALAPEVAEVVVYDNSQDVEPGQPVPDPMRVAHVVQGQLRWPHDTPSLKATPGWARPFLEAMLQR